MRKIQKRSCPAILLEKAAEWLKAYQDDSAKSTNRYRYRHEDVKSELVKETGNKCVYCESKIGHSTPGDVEHKVPTALGTALHFDWNNLTIACTECNRRKSATYDPALGFIDPYNDAVESLVIHHGPIATWKPGDNLAETAVRVLELDSPSRMTLVLQKIEFLRRYSEAVENYKSCTNPTLRKVRKLALDKWKEKDAEYSAMILSSAAKYGV
ncbi:HNH endonuclease [Botrimarina mediterranea]|uniref:HNH endonuclease n=1 Tax=Botrimarina mediterranea TaxID=2528022 RepID=UPI0011888F30|nr:HNH endonuclease [Planctomycetes bacterium K2D]